MRVAFVGVALTVWLGLCLVGCAPGIAGESATAFMLAQARPMLIFATAKEAPKYASKYVRASWYGGGEYLNARTATGERFNPNGRTAAHRSLPFGTRLEVVNLSTGLSTTVRINDRGPALWTGRDLDLARAAAAEIGMIRAGEARVSYRIVN